MEVFDDIKRLSLLLVFALCAGCADSFDDVCHNIPLPINAQGQIVLDGYWLDCPMVFDNSGERLCLFRNGEMKTWTSFNGEPVVNKLRVMDDGFICVESGDDCSLRLNVLKKINDSSAFVQMGERQDGHVYGAAWRSVQCEL